MDQPEEPPPPTDPERPQASRRTTVLLTVSLVLVVMTAGVLGTVAVLMTRSPDAPFIGAKPPQRLSVPVHFAAVRETKAAPCPGEEAALDQRQTTCYLLEDGVTVNAVQKIEAVREKDGTYSVRVAVAPAYKQKLVDLMDELVPDRRQIAVVLVPRTVVAAPIVTQSLDGDSLSIVGFSKQEAEALAAQLLGGTPGPSQPATDAPATGAPDTGVPGTGAPATGVPDTGVPTTAAPTTAAPTTGVPATGTPATRIPTTGAPTTAGTDPAAAQGGDPRFKSCKEAVAAGYGPYIKGLHKEYAWYPDLDRSDTACNPADIR